MMANLPEPSPTQIRAALPESSHRRSLLAGCLVFAATAILFGTTLVGAVVVDTLAWRLVLGLVNGLAAGMLFIVGHDACHGSLTPSPFANALIGRLAFLPALTPYTAWAYSHNARHHGWTNLRERDPVYAPLTKAEFDALSPWGRFVERLYRTTFGVALLWLFRIWWAHEIAPRRGNAPPERVAFELDRALVLAYLGTVLGGIAVASEAPASFAARAATGVVLPFVVWSFLAGFLTFMHHTHPDVRWFDRVEEWSFYRGHLCSTVHVRFPTPVARLLLNIMDHTAHHVDMKIPLYRLPRCQDALVTAFPGIVSVRWTLASYLDTLRRCRLYDYREQAWLDWDGTPTTARLR